MGTLYDAYDRTVSRSVDGEESSSVSLLRSMIKAQRDAARRRKEEGERRLKEQERDLLKQEYVRTEQSKRALPQQMAAIGNGGVSESSLIGLESDYASSRSDIQRKTMEQINKLNSDIDMDLNDRLQGYYKVMTDYMNEERARRSSQERWEAEMEYKKENDAYDREQDALKSRRTKSYSAPSAANESDLQKTEEEKQARMQKAIESDKWNKLGWNDRLDDLYNTQKGYMDYCGDNRDGIKNISRAHMANSVKSAVESHIKNGKITVKEGKLVLKRLGLR